MCDSNGHICMPCGEHIRAVYEQLVSSTYMSDGAGILYDDIYSAQN